MKKMTVNELREAFLSFFESKDHLRLPSFSLIPHNDNSLLLINSGMAPLKPYFTGQEIPPRKRVTTCQKCIRTGDIENIGHTARHGTFFEMLGNFSFGDYFKKEAITWSWEFLTEVVGLDKNRLYPSVYKDDDEAFELWNKMIGIPKERIFRFGKEDNFWEHGSGPCGPCSEIYYDRGEKYGCGKPTCTVGCDCDRYIEVWNNVFTQFDNDGHNNYTELKQKNIDTGMGLERLAVVCQDAESIFEVDTNKNLLDSICALANCKYKEDKIKDISLRIVCDHIKSCTFMISDGIMPSNEGRGYVLRRLLRRAVRHGRTLGIKHKFMKDLSSVVVDLCGDGYPELREKEAMIKQVIDNEEENFNKTIDQGLKLLEDICSKMTTKIFDAKDAFKLYDTFGFPFDLTKEILEEKNIEVSEDDFKTLMEEQKVRARKARKVSNYMGADATIFEKLPKEIECKFVGYDDLNHKSKIVAITTDNEIVNEISEGFEGTILLDETSFYATMGGEEGDNGIIKNGVSEFEVLDCFKVLGNKICHFGKVTKGSFSVGDEVVCEVNKEERELTRRNHTATHLLQAALRKVLGSHVEQAGSSVNEEHLRFDFTHFKPMTSDEIKKVEDLVNEKIQEGIETVIKEMPIDEAKKLGAMALFGEKYGKIVRTVKVADFSFELCGGCHVKNTKDIQFFKIISEQGLAQGVRRIEALTSKGLLEFYNEEDKKLIEVSEHLKTQKENVIQKIDSLFAELQALKKENESLNRKLASGMSSAIEGTEINGAYAVIEKIETENLNDLKNIADDIKSKHDNSFVFLVAQNANVIKLVCAASDVLVAKGLDCGKVIKECANILGGNGGGRKNFAEGSGKDNTKMQEALNKAKEIIEKI